MAKYVGLRWKWDICSHCYQSIFLLPTGARWYHDYSRRAACSGHAALNAEPVQYMINEMDLAWP